MMIEYWALSISLRTLTPSDQAIVIDMGRLEMMTTLVDIRIRVSLVLLTISGNSLTDQNLSTVRYYSRL